MGRGPEVDDSIKNRVIGAILAGEKIAEAARMFHLPWSTTDDIWKRYQKRGDTKNLPRPGRPPKLSDADTRQIVRLLRKERRMPFKEIGNTLNLDASASTIRRAAKAQGYYRRVARKRPYLTKAHKAARLQWGKKYQRWRYGKWSKVIWSDECYVYLGDTRGRVYVTRQKGEEMLDECIVPTFKQSSVRVMIWGCIMRGVKGPLVVLEYPGGRGGGMNSTRYRDQVLEPVLKSFYQRMKAKRGPVLFMHDGAPSHRSKMTTIWLTGHAVNTLFHPAQSPDLNPIEWIWHELKDKIRSLKNPPTTTDTLKAAVLAAWNSLDVATINKHVDGMQARVEAILAAKGGHTSF